VGSGEECLREVQANAPDIMLLDYKLPGMTGIDVLNALAAAHKDIVVVMVTAYASLETAVRATKLGAYDFLAKPFTPGELRYVMRKAATNILLARRNRRLEEEKRRIRFEFLSVLAHELKAPLNAVEGYLDILAERLSGDERYMVDRSLARIGGAKKLIFDLLDLTRIESGLKRRETKRLDLVPLLRSALEAVELDARAKKLTVELDAAPEVVMNADAGEIEIVFNNLVSNAVKYNREGGRVRVALSRRDDGAVIFEVRDTGVGLKPEDAAKLFKEFVRIRTPETSKVSGSGLGLSTVKKLAQIYGGDAVVASEPGKGSVFTVTLRDAAAAAENTQKGGQSHVTSIGH
jgi:signal transduction histidine kinase